MSTNDSGRPMRPRARTCSPDSVFAIAANSAFSIRQDEIATHIRQEKELRRAEADVHPFFNGEEESIRSTSPPTRGTYLGHPKVVDSWPKAPAKSSESRPTTKTHAALAGGAANDLSISTRRASSALLRPTHRRCRTDPCAVTFTQKLNFFTAESSVFSGPRALFRLGAETSEATCGESAATPDVDALRRELASRRIRPDADMDVEVGRILHCVGVSLGQKERPECEFEAISALEEALSTMQRLCGPGEEESAVVAHNLWVLLHNVRARHERLMREMQRSRQLWRNAKDEHIFTAWKAYEEPK